MNNTSLTIETRNLNHHYSKRIQTLFDIDLRVPAGSVYGFLGPNGSGKTTTLSLILGLLNVKEGSVEVFGKSFKDNRIDILRQIGSLIESPSLYGHLSAIENLDLYRHIYDISAARIKEVLDIVGLSDTGSKLVKRFSLGMKQRLAIALALLPNPKLLVLDEPSNGLDPAGIIELRKLIRRLNTDMGMTIVISSHLLTEVEKMVSHVGIIYKGRMLFQGSLAELYAFQQKDTRILLRTSDNNAAMHLLEQYKVVLEDQFISLPFQSDAQLARINRQMMENNLDVYLLSPKEQDLEQLFINLTSSQS